MKLDPLNYPSAEEREGEALSPVAVEMRHFLSAIAKVKPSVSEKVRKVSNKDSGLWRGDVRVCILVPQNWAFNSSREGIRFFVVSACLCQKPDCVKEACFGRPANKYVYNS